jgi:hypothetical protein|tara:strand:- start:2187 stop:2342 length:156 start_codon:yes stop_codon:yes gene_type:complete
VKLIEINSIVVKDDIIGIVMDIIFETAYIWWNVPGKYRIEPHDISTLRLLE